MIPVAQTTDDNCFAAACASVLELRLNQVPRSIDKQKWLDNWRKWLSKRGLSVEWYNAEDRKTPRGWSILSVYRKDGIRTHACVCYDGEIVHDPAGDIERVRKAKRNRWYVFTTLRPERVICQ